MKFKGMKKTISLVTTVAILGIITLLGDAGIIDIKLSDVDKTDISAQTNEDKINKIQGVYEVVRVVDGDTIIINYNGTQERVRMIGIDTAESVHPDKEKNTQWGTIASDYTKKMLTGKSVGIEFDVDERDQYGRILAYVYLDGEMYNKKLLEIGYAQIATYPPNVKYVDDFTAIQKQARENQVGVWAN